MSMRLLSILSRFFTSLSPARRTATDASFQETEARSQEVLAEQVRLVYSGAPEAYITTILNALLLTYIQRNVVASSTLLAWLAFIVVVTLVRTGVVIGYWRAKESSVEATRRWDRLYRAGATLSGIGWGAAGVLLFPAESIAHQVFLLLVLAGMTAGAVVVLPARMETCRAFMIPILLPVTFRLFTMGDEVHIAMGAMASLFLLAMLVIARRMHRTINTSLNFRFANRDLISYLTAAKGRAERLNEELAGEITRRKRTEAILRESQEQLLQSQKMDAVGKLAGGIAHEFNNLLQIINGYSQVLSRRLSPDDPSRSDLDEIRTAGVRAAALTNQLLTFSRRQVIQPKVLDLNEVVRNLSGMLQRLIGEDIELVTMLDSPVGRVKADPGQLDQIIINLVLNACDAMPRGGRITFETVPLDLDEGSARKHGLIRPGRYAMLAVSDTGSGMDEATKARIFEPFFTTKEQDKAMGLGLSTVYGMVQKNGGSISVDSVKGRGTIFRIYLPLTEETPAPAAVKDSPDVSLKGSETVLLVEDDQSVRTLIQGVLRRQGYQVLEAQNAHEALRVCHRHGKPIHLLLADVGMPGLSGPQLADRLVPQQPGLKVLYMSGYAEDAKVRKGLSESSAPFLQKPFEPDILVRRLRELLDASR